MLNPSSCFHLLLACSLLICPALPAHINLAATKTPPEVNALKSYGAFSHVLLQQAYRRGNSTSSNNAGVGLFSTFGLGYLLAVLSDSPWKLDTKGFNLALKAPLAQIVPTYSSLLQVLNQDPELQVRSDIYTSRLNVTYKNAEALRTPVTFTNYNDTVENVNKAAGSINGFIGLQTRGRINDTVVPHAGWWGLPFFNYTQGVFTNTMYFKSNLNSSILRVVEGDFESAETVPGVAPKPVKYVETTGFLVSGPAADHTALQIPFKNSNKSLVFILPNDKMSKFIKYEMDEYFQPRPLNTTNLPVVKARIPVLNLTLPAKYFSQLKKMGITEAMCRYDKRIPNVIDSIIQYSHVSLGQDLAFEATSATASHMNNVEDFLDVQQSGSEPIGVPDIGDEAELHADFMSKSRSDLVERSPSSEMTSSETLGHAQVLPMPKRPAAAPGLHERLLNATTEDFEGVKFNRPFFFFLNDANFGPVFFGSVSSFEQYDNYQEDKQNVQPGFEWMDHALRYLLWSCP